MVPPLISFPNPINSDLTCIPTTHRICTLTATKLRERGHSMPTYIGLMNFTEQGVKTIKDLPARLSSARQLMASKGATLHSYFLTMGQYDAVAIGEAPDDEAVASLLLAQAGVGNLRSTTLRAFTEEEIPASSISCHKGHRHIRLPNEYG